MKSRVNWPMLLAVGMVVLVCGFGLATMQPQETASSVPRAQWRDSTPLGGKGLRRLLERLGYTVRRTDARLKTMPADARVWLLLDPQTQFSRAETEQLLRWVQNGGTLIWSAAPDWYFLFSGSSPGGLGSDKGRSGIDELRRKLGIADRSFNPTMLDWDGEPLPPLTPLKAGAVSHYWNGVKSASGSGDWVETTSRRPSLEIAGTLGGSQITRVTYGKGRVFLTPDALLFTNYALSRLDTSVLVTNLIGVHVPPGAGAVYFDERQHGEAVKTEFKPSLLYYLWQPPLRYAILQLLGAALLMWAFYGRRLGAPQPLPESEPVTRAGQFAVAMGALFHKAQRPRAAATITGEEFRRALTRRLGLSIADSDAEIARRAAEATDLPAQMIDRLLLNAKAPSDHEAQILSDVQEMEIVLRKLNLH